MRGIFKAIRRRWRMWKVRQTFRTLDREADELRQRIQKERARKKRTEEYYGRLQEITIEKLRMERKARFL